MFSHLKSQRVNLQLLQEAAHNELVQHLERIEGSKVVVLDKALVLPLGLVTEVKVFTERNIKLIVLSGELDVPKDVTNIIYIVRPQVSLMDQVGNHVMKLGQQGRQFHIFFVPRRSCLCEKQLENKGYLSSFGSVEELSWNFLPLDADVVSMELPHAYRDVTIDGDTTSLYQAAMGLVQLQRLYGRIPKIYGKGVQAQRVWDHAKQLAINEKSLYNGDKGAIDQLILLDRGIDLLTPLATQLTYEGLIDELFGIQQNKLMMPAHHFPASNIGIAGDSFAKLLGFPNTKIISLHSGEEGYSELRNKHFNEVIRLLERKVKELNIEMNKYSREHSVRQLHIFVDKLKILEEEKRAMSQHTEIATLIQTQVNEYTFAEDVAAEQEFMVCADIDKTSVYIEDQIARKNELRNVLRLICLQCAAASGLKEKVLNSYKRDLAQVYGLEVLLTVSNLEKAGLLYPQTESRSYAVLRKTLRLTVEDSVEVEPKDISYVHSFYAPLTTRLVELSLKPLGWQSLKSQITNLPGPTFEDFQAQLIGIGGRHVGTTPSEGSLLHVPRVVLVCFVGGCTFAEIAALRFLAAQEDNHVEFVVATTNIINKHTFLDSVMGS
ncbi:vacuolar protein sorting-associated protein 33A [Scaptodrosophila lebanonensis]|uniref:Vacuolar protein sorting-associated protein 33A n=1 Tax=Drosophila lebanonensis TaxID=7225 RepID=A0A6J2U4Q5_DROLE|nr:vacuolar protein sorting-associated protein 33A [Scaptodrosophila lebanonensis]